MTEEDKIKMKQLMILNRLYGMYGRYSEKVYDRILIYTDTDNIVCTLNGDNTMDEYNEFYKAWQDGFKAGYEAARKETFRDHYEALCQEIREDERKKIFALIKEHYDGETRKGV